RVHELAGTKLLGAAATQLLAYCLLITKQVELVVGETREARDSRVAKVQLSQVAQRAVAEEHVPLAPDPRAASPFPGTPSPSVTATALNAEVPKTRRSSAKIPGLALQKRKDEILARAQAIKSEDYFQM